MKTLSLMLLMLVPACAAAQEAPAAQAESHGVSVVKARWQKRVYNPALDEDPMASAPDYRRLELERRETQRVNAARAARGQKALPTPMQNAESTASAPPNETTTYYLYEAKVVNTGAKKIRSLLWEYVLFDHETEREVGRHLFESKVGIGAGKSAGLTAWSTQPPAAIVNASKSHKESHGQFTERVDIRRVEYEDGTVWEREQK
jgi:hypothetical protein